MSAGPRITSKLWIIGLLATAMLATVLSTNADAGVQQARFLDNFNGDFGTPPSLAFSPDGIPTVAYYDPDVAALRVVTCDGPNCSGTAANNIIAGIENGVAWPSIRFNPSGNPVIAYWDDFSIDLARCADPECNSIASTRSVASGPEVFGIPAMALTEGGLAVIAFLDADFRLNIVRCDNLTCSQSSTTWVPLPDEVVGSVPSIEITDTGRIVVAYVTNQSDTARPLRIVECKDLDCSSPFNHLIETAFFYDGGVAAHPTDPSYLLVGGSSFTFNDATSAPAQDEFFVRQFDACSGDAGGCRTLDFVSRPSFQGAHRFAAGAELAVDEIGRPVIAYIDVELTGALHIASVPADGGGPRVASPNASLTTDIFAPDIQIQDGRAAIAVVARDGLHITVCNDSRCIPSCAGQMATVDMTVGGELAIPEAGDIVSGTPGNDTIDAGHTICARGGNDVIRGVDLGGQVFAGQGNDIILMQQRGFVSAGPGNDRVVGSRGSDRIQGGPGRDDLFGMSGNDRISGGSGNDTIFGNNGDDELLGTLGRDTLDGGADNDILRGGGWIDSLDGGQGNDDRCSTIEGEVRINCERGIFGI